MDLAVLFDQINIAHFDGFLDPPELRYNSRLRSSAGRFMPGSRKYWLERKPTIEVAYYLLELENARELVLDTLGHEMIHYWLWVRRKPYGHTPEFWEKMQVMGVSRYNTVPKTRPYRYVYRCFHCAKEFFARRKLGKLACASCCKAYSNGRFDARFALFLDRKLNADEGLQLARAPV